jgi:hypothetical protein
MVSILRGGQLPDASLRIETHAWPALAVRFCPVGRNVVLVERVQIDEGESVWIIY